MQANKLTLHIYIRKIHAINKGHKVQQYEYLTSTSGLCQHLMKDHLDDWVKSCDKADIKITANKAKAVVDEYHHHQGEYVLDLSNPTSWPKFSKMAFVDAMVEFITAEDMVSRLICVVLECS